MSSNPSSGSGPGGPPRKGGKKKFFVRRKRVCKFTVEKIGYIDFKDVKLLGQFRPERAKILPRRISGTPPSTSGSWPGRSAGPVSGVLPYVAD